MHSRLEPLAKGLGFGSLPELVATLRRTPDNRLHKEVVEAMTTNETRFFRDGMPFVALKDHLLPALIKRRRSNSTLSIWCGASSSGQEPYSILLTILEHFPDLKRWDIRLMATDISQRMLKRCLEGVYSQHEINRGLPADLLAKYFSSLGTHWQIAEEVREKITVQEINLAGPWPRLANIDLVVLRNVLMYFDEETKKRILWKVRNILDPYGFLLLGGTETTIPVDEQYEQIPIPGTSCYRLRMSEGSGAGRS